MENEEDFWGHRIKYANDRRPSGIPEAELLKEIEQAALLDEPPNSSTITDPNVQQQQQQQQLQKPAENSANQEDILHQSSNDNQSASENSPAQNQQNNDQLQKLFANTNSPAPNSDRFYSNDSFDSESEESDDDEAKYDENSKNSTTGSGSNSELNAVEKTAQQFEYTNNAENENGNREPQLAESGFAANERENGELDDIRDRLMLSFDDGTDANGKDHSVRKSKAVEPKNISSSNTGQKKKKKKQKRNRLKNEHFSRQKVNGVDKKQSKEADKFLPAPPGFDRRKSPAEAVVQEEKAVSSSQVSSVLSRTFSRPVASARAVALTDKLYELEAQLKQLLKEKRTLETVQKRQDALLARQQRQLSTDGSAASVDQYKEEIRVLRARLRQDRLQLSEQERILLCRTKALQKATDKVRRLEMTLNDEERNQSKQPNIKKKDKKSENGPSSDRLEQQQHTVARLKRQLELLEKNHRHAMDVELAKHKQTKKHLEQLQSHIAKKPNGLTQNSSPLIDKTTKKGHQKDASKEFTDTAAQQKSATIFTTKQQNKIAPKTRLSNSVEKTGRKKKESDNLFKKETGTGSSGSSSTGHSAAAAAGGKLAEHTNSSEQKEQSSLSAAKSTTMANATLAENINTSQLIAKYNQQNAAKEKEKHPATAPPTRAKNAAAKVLSKNAVKQNTNIREGQHQEQQNHNNSIIMDRTSNSGGIHQNQNQNNKSKSIDELLGLNQRRHSLPVNGQQNCEAEDPFADLKPTRVNRVGSRVSAQSLVVSNPAQQQQQQQHKRRDSLIEELFGPRRSSRHDTGKNGLSVTQITDQELFPELKQKPRNVTAQQKPLRF